ncbi:hypothetical protein D3C76_1151950 [compost metagenome]
MFLAEQHHVDVAHVLPADPQRRGAEHLAPVRAARVVAEDRQHVAGEEAPQRRQVHPLAAQAAGWRGVAEDAAVGAEQVQLDAGVDHHQLAEQRARRVRAHAGGIAEVAVAGDGGGQVAGQSLHHFQLAHLAGAQLQPHGSAAGDQQQHSEHQRQALAQAQPHASLPGAANL